MRLLLVLALLITAGSAQDPLDSMDAAVRLGIHERHFPGGVLWFQHQDKVYHKAYGSRALKPSVVANAKGTLYDAASLTKVLATTPSIMLLVERGLIDLAKPVSTYVPEFKGDGKERILVRQLMTHTSGLRPGISSKPAWSGYGEGLKRIWAEKPIHEPDTKFVYSDINFILLGELVHRVSGMPLDKFCRVEIHGPLKMNDTIFTPAAALRDRIAPTTVEEEGVVHGIVHDPTSRRMGGVTGHAGLFTTAADVAKYATMLLQGGKPIFKRETIAIMTRPQQPDSITAARGLGWDINSPYASLRGQHYGPTSFGHTGWTGTSLWVDPPSQSFITFLSNRNHPTEAGRTRAVRITLSSLAAEATEHYQMPHPREVLNGVDVLANRRFRDLKGLRVGLITNHTGRTRDDRSTIDLLHKSPQVTLKALFGPEHGIRGEMDQAEIADGKDTKTGLPIYSLYGATKKPKKEQLANLDALVFDIQDIGCRFYTYISTMRHSMEAAAANKLKFVVLDRINPINGHTIDGPVRDGESSFTATHPIPLRHGMTVGELAILMKRELNLDLDLHVVPVSGWRRGFYQNDTDLSWINPSPNMRNLDEAILYPGIGLLEFMKLSVGRGTETPFEVIGAPYLDAAALKKHVDAYALPGVTIETVDYSPTASKFKGEVCHGLRLTLTDRDAYRSVDMGLAIASYIAKHHAEIANFSKFKKLLVHPKTFELVKSGAPLRTIHGHWRAAREDFAERRSSCLLY